MLSAFTARPIVELKARDRSKIESLVAYGDRLLVGLNTGVLRVYRVNEVDPEGAGAAKPAGPDAEGAVQDVSGKAAKAGKPDKSAGTTHAGGASAASKPADLLREVEKFSSRAIEQLAIIKEADVLVSLASYAVHLHDLQTYQPLAGASPLPGTKNASSFAVTSNIVNDPSTGIPEIVSRLAVAVKRRLLLWSWYASEMSTGLSRDDASTDVPEIVLPETIRSLTWADATKLVIGMNAGYVLVDVVTREMTDIVGSSSGDFGASSNGSAGSGNGNGHGHANETASASRFGAFSSAGMGYMGLGNYMPKPLAAKLSDGSSEGSDGKENGARNGKRDNSSIANGGVVLLAKDVHTLFISAETGKPIPDKRPIPWPSAPESIGYSYPYILALQPPAKGSLEIRNPDTLSVLQKIELPGAAQLHVPPPSVSLAHAGKGFHVSSERGIWKMDATGYDSQVDALVEQGRLDEAISLLGLLEDALLANKAATLRAVKMQKAERLFRQKRYLDSIDLFNEEDVHAPPERVFRFFPRSIVGDLSDEPVEEPVEEEDDDEESEGSDGSEELEQPQTKEGESEGAEESAEASDAAKAKAGDTKDDTNGHTKDSSDEAAPRTPKTPKVPKTPKTPPPQASATKVPKSPSSAAHTSVKEEAAAASEATSSISRAGFTKMFLSRKGNAETASIASTRKDAGSVPPSPQIPAVAGSGEAPPQTPSKDHNGHHSYSHGNANGYVPLEGKELKKAAEALNSYLAGTRARLQRVIDPATGKLKDRARKQRKQSGGLGRGGVDDSDYSDDDCESEEEHLKAIFTLVDTTMFRVLMLIRPKLASSLFRIPNFCDPDVVNERLLATSRYNELVDFFYGKKLHRPALELLKRFGQRGLETEKEKTVDEKDSSKGQDARSLRSVRSKESKKSHHGHHLDHTNHAHAREDVPLEEIPPALRGPRRTVAYLQSLPPEMIDLILEFSGWTLKADPDLGMEIFLADSENAETLPRDRVVRFLAELDVRLEIHYLAHIIGELNDLTPDFHNRLIEQTVRVLKEGVPAEPEDDSDEEDDKQHWEITMDKLVTFLKESRQYSLSRAFGLIPRDDPAFYEAQAVVLSNMGQHKQALEIYVFKMHDFDKAEDYCNRIHLSQDAMPSVAPTSPTPRAIGRAAGRVHRPKPSRSSVHSDEESTHSYTYDDDNDPSTPSAPSIYHTLLGLYLQPPPPYQPQRAPALELLSRHGSRLPAASTLQLIPDGLPVAQLESYFRGRMRAANSVVNESRIEKGLRQTAALAAQAEVSLGPGGGGAWGDVLGAVSMPGGRNRRVVVSEERVCGVCHKRLGGSVVAVLPDNAVVHYGCLNRAGRGAGGGAASAAGSSALDPNRFGSWGRR